MFNKLDFLLQRLTELKLAAIAFSGGVDSTFLAAAAKKALGDRVVAVTAWSETLTWAEKEESGLLAQKIGIRQVLLPSGELSSRDFTANTSKRCYFCKKERFGVIRKWTEEHGIPWIAEGSNADDLQDYRPGMKVLKEIEGVVSPLLEAGLRKDEIRELSKIWGLPTFDKPSESCLATRIVYGIPITEKRLGQVAQAEVFLKKFCLGPVRVRHHDDLARIEVAPEEIPLIVQGESAVKIRSFLKELGFSYVTVDLAGYRTGSMNEGLKNEY